VRRVDLPGAIDAVALLGRLGRDAPVSHAALAVDGAGGAVVSHSPELLLRARADGRLETRPIKGTARLADHAPSAAGAAASGRDAAGAEAAYRALLASAKERAEHLMIVDLERNDLGRIARTGTVRVEELFGRLDLPHLVHLESTISAEPRDGLSPWEAVAAVFPGGSITGAPKLKAMELIRALEPARRGVSMGAVGWIGSGSLHLNVAIRTLSRPGGHPGGRPGCGWRYHVGGGIVVDSDPAAEWRETETKERALREAAAALAQL
jgi:anthranilate/para-aminobenzoate synthase component I